MSTTAPNMTTSACTKVQVTTGNWLTKPLVLHVTMHGDVAYDVENFRPCLVHKRYSPYDRWHVVEAVRAFGLDVLDDYLPFAIESPDTIVYAVAPLPPDYVQILRSFYGGAKGSDATRTPIVAFPVPEPLRSRDDLLAFAKIAQDAYDAGPMWEAIVLLGTKTRLTGVPTMLWWISDLRSHQVDLLVILYRFFFMPPSGTPEPYYSIAKSWWPVERKYASSPFRSSGGYEPFNRWEIVEMVHSFGLDVMDNVLPYIINNNHEVVHAMLPNDKLSMQIYRTHLTDLLYPSFESSYVGIRVTDYANTLDEFIEMLVASRNLLIVTASNKVVQVNVGALRKQNSPFIVALRHDVLQRALQYKPIKRV